MLFSSKKISNTKELIKQIKIKHQIELDELHFKHQIELNEMKFKHMKALKTLRVKQKIQIIEAENSLD